MLHRSFAAAVLVVALFAPRVSFAADGGPDADVDGAVDGGADAALDASLDATDGATDAAKDAGEDVVEPPPSDGGPITFRPDADPEPDASTPVPTVEEGGCSAGGAGTLASWPAALVVLAYLRGRKRPRA